MSPFTSASMGWKVDATGPDPVVSTLAQPKTHPEVRARRTRETRKRGGIMPGFRVATSGSNTTTIGTFRVLFVILSPHRLRKIEVLFWP